MNKFKISQYKAGDKFSCEYVKQDGNDNYGNVIYVFKLTNSDEQMSWSLKDSDQRSDMLSYMKPGELFFIELKDTGKAYPYATILSPKEVTDTTNFTTEPAPVHKQYSNPPVSQSKDVDWDKIAEGKVRHGVACAFIQHGINKLTPDVEKDINDWVEFIVK